MILLDGKSLSEKIKRDLINKLGCYENCPCLSVISVGDNASSKIYINNKKKACEQVGISFIHIHYEENIKEEKIIKKIKELNKDKNINGIIVQLPLPKKFDERKIINHIDSLKDVDGLTYNSSGKLFNNKSTFIPCTVKGIMEILNHYKIDLESKNVVIIGRSNLVGKPLMIECLNKNATVTICHSKTLNLREYTKNADILIVAVGQKYLIDKYMIKKDCIIIDVGINKVDGKIYGDVNPDVNDLCSYKTPVPGGVGPMTVCMLMKNTVDAFKEQNGYDE